MNGETECACPAGEVIQDGTCAACPDGQFVQGGACIAASVESCGGLTPEKFYDSAAGECVPFVECAAPAVLNAGTNLCDCPAPNAGTDGAAAPGDCVAASVESCEGLTPPKLYDSAAGACVAVAACIAPAVLNAGTNLCDCPAPNVGTDGAAAPGDCAVLVPSVENCKGLTPAQFYSATPSACVPFVECAAPAVLNAGANLCDCPAPNIGTDGAAAPGDCAAPSAESCGGLTPAQFYSATLSACVPFVECAAPAVLNAGTNRCDCPAPNVGTDGADAPGDCAAPSAEVCGGLSPAKFYDSATGACVAIAECAAPAVLNAGANLCDCPSPSVGTDGADAPGDCACPIGQLVKGGACAAPTTPEEKCTAAGWHSEVAAQSPWYCFVKVNDGNASNDFCIYDGATTLIPAPYCTAVFGADYSFPFNPNPSVTQDRQGNKRPEYVYNCDPDDENGLIPATINTIGATECACPAGQALQGGTCVAASAEVCGGLSPAKFYDSAAGECVAVAACVAPAVLNAGANLCDCPAPNIGTDGASAPGDCAAPSAEVCGGLSPAKFYDSAAGACVAVAECAAPAVLNAGTNLCDCPAPNAGTDGAAAPGDCAAASVESCGGLSPAKFYDSAAGVCVAVAACIAPAVLDADANLCDCPTPNVGTDGAAAPGDCAVPAPSVENCAGLTPAQFYSATPSACIPFVECAAPAELNTGTNLCDCPVPNIGTDGAASPGDCVPVAECAAPAVLNTGANLCDCPAPNIGTDRAAAPGDCVAPGVGSCGGLTPAKFYDSAAGECGRFGRNAAAPGVA